MRWMIVQSFVAWASGCAVVSGSYCDIAGPIWFDTDGDVVATPASVRRQILIHNDTVDALCGFN